MLGYFKQETNLDSFKSKFVEWGNWSGLNLSIQEFHLIINFREPKLRVHIQSNPVEKGDPKLSSVCNGSLCVCTPTIKLDD